jgi:hypothetical protein
VDRLVVDAGLAVFEAGGDFADGVIAFEGGRQGGSIFSSVPLLNSFTSREVPQSIALAILPTSD